MVFGLSNPFKKRDSDKINFERNIQLTAADNQMKQNSPEADYIAMMGKMGYMVMDENFINLLFSNEMLHPLIPVFSPLNATIKLDKQQAELKRIRLENFISMLKLTAPPEVYNSNGMEVLDGMRLFGHDRVSEAVEGWKGHLVTEQVTKIQTQQLKEKTGPL